MNGHTDGFYEIEFQRMFKMQGKILRNIRTHKKQLACYINKREDLREWGGNLRKIEARIELTKDRKSVV